MNTTPSIPPFPYTRIPPTSFRCLRLTSIHPQIHFDLHTFPVDAAPTYAALSYAWGLLPASVPCLCNNHPFLVSPTLRRALESIYELQQQGKEEQEQEWLWVDAICINQRDDVEKAGQVAGMAEVYSFADRVLVWLGEDADGGAEALARMPGIAEGLGRSLEEDEEGNGDEEEMRKLPPATDPVWPALLRIFTRPWFSRLWIVQELALAREAVFLCGGGSGSGTVGWADIVRFTRGFSRSRIGGRIGGAALERLGGMRASASSITGIRLINNVSRFAAAWAADEPQPLVWNVLRIMQSQAATEPLDFAYGVLGLVPDPVRAAVVVDYSPACKARPRALHAAFFKLLLRQMSYWPSAVFPGADAETDTDSSPPAAAPSWCPSFGVGTWTPALPLVGTGAGFPSPTSSAWALRKPLTILPDEPNNPHILSLAGAPIATITALHPLTAAWQRQDSSGRTPIDTTLLALLQHTLAFCHPLTSSPDSLPGILIANPHWRADTDFADMPASLEANFLDHLTAYVAAAARDPTPLDDAAAWLGPQRVLRAFLNRVLLAWTGRALALTVSEGGGKSRLALVPARACAGDRIAVVWASHKPFVLRPCDRDGGCWEFVGPGFVDGVMHGEMWEDGNRGVLGREEVFRLV